MQQFSMGPLIESRSTPGGRQLVGQDADLTFESRVGYFRPNIYHRHLYYCSLFLTKTRLLFLSCFGAGVANLSEPHSSFCSLPVTAG